MTPASKNAANQFPSHFYCDHCGEVIDNLPQGWLLWETNKEGKYHNFKIVHFECMKKNKYLDKTGQSSTLDHFAGFNGLALFLTFLDIGIWATPEYRGPEVEDIREYVEIFRRLFVPHYEEARRLFDETERDEFFQEANGAWEHKLETLEKVIDKYGKKE